MQKTFGDKLKKSVDNWFDTKSVGGHIPINRFDEWIDFKARCEAHGISVSYEGFFHMLTTMNKIDKVLFPLAEKCGCNPLDFEKEVIDIMLVSLGFISENPKIFEKIEEAHTEIMMKIDKNFKNLSEVTKSHNVI